MLRSTLRGTGCHMLLSHTGWEGTDPAGLQALLSSLGESWMRAPGRRMPPRQAGRQRSRACLGPSLLTQGQQDPAPT